MNSSRCTDSICKIDAGSGRLGWTSAPNYRGTLDIIWSCALTLFLCCWSILVVNVPRPGSTYWQLVVRKLCLVGLSLMAPELVFQVALGQWLSARESVILFNKSGYTDWTIRHGFYANMGGFLFQPAEWKSFPIDAKQLHYLVARGYVKYPRISDVYIRDKNKIDGMLRFITLVQTLWFLLNVIVRACQGLTVTALELSTAAFVWLAIVTSLCWMSKPADVAQVDCITSETSMADILREGGDAASGIYYYTPLDFVSRAEWPWSKLWNHGLNLLHHLRWPGAAPPTERPINRFQNTVIPAVGGWYQALWLIVSSSYFAIFLLGWNFSFPTQIESILWQSASLISLLSAWVIYCTMSWRYSWYPELKLKLRAARSLQQTEPCNESHLERQHAHKETRWFRVLLAFSRNNSAMKDPALDTPATLILVTWIFGALYSVSRTYIVLADVIELRSLPASAYRVAEWSSFWPHV